ncbi:MAG TPA: MMPL family transporter [Candidatus Saccharimonadales bacterium]|nr:MMPL family transporter [Candidatus Saccharimonadales bacterium]
MSAQQTTPPLSKSHKLAALVCGRKTKWVVLVFWFAVLMFVGPLAGKLNGAQSNNVSTWLPGKAESTQVLNIQSKFQSADDVPGVVVYQRSTGLTETDKAKITANAARFSSVRYVVGPAQPIFSSDGRAAETLVMAKIGANGWDKATGVADDLRKLAGGSGLDVHVAGPLGQASDSAKAFNGIDSTLLYAALGVVTVLLLITYRSPLLWLLPVISAGVALACAQSIVYLLAKHAGLIVNGQSAGILTVLVFGAATDYALLLIARYREELHNHQDRHEAMAIALHRAGPAIIASASTVVVGMLCLLAAALNSTHSLGPVAAIGITAGLLVMLTLLPALLVILGRWLFWPVIPHFGTEVPSARGLWAKIGRQIAKRPRTVWIVTVAILAVMSIGLVGLKANGLKTEDSYRNTPDSVVGERVLASHFTAAGSGEPVVVVGKTTSAAELYRAVRQTAGLTAVTSPVAKDGDAFIQATLTSAPDSDAANATIDRLRATVHTLPGAEAKVGGSTAIVLDSERASSRDSKVIIPLVLAVVFIILAILLRSLAAPFLLILTVVLSFAATLGACAQIFNHVFHFAGADTSFPLFVFVFLVALGIDYNIFLMTRIREEAKKGDTRQAALAGLAATGAVITSAGAVLAGTFAVLGTLPLTMLAEIGFTVAFGVLLDTLIVRSVLVTSLTLDLGRKIWWPSKLWRDSKK